MSTFSIVGESSACAINESVQVYTFPFGPGSIVFNCEKAQRGVMEAIAIKCITVVQNIKTGGLAIPLYTDTLNGLWNEDELCLEADAKAYAIAYLQQQQAEILDILSSCG
jgi:hypothetical protein